jgi:CheY-like chemotaxis protein
MFVSDQLVPPSRLQNIEPINLTRLVIGAVDDVRNVASARGVTIRLNLDTHSGTVLGDPRRLRHEVSDMLLNVLARAIPGSVVEIAVSRDDVRAEIRLGLEGSSEPPIDSAVTLRLPLLPFRVGEPGAAVRPLDTLDACRGIRVLVVDDEPDARQLVADVLTHYGAEVDIAESTLLALAALNQVKYDVLVTDIAMPFDDGFSLLYQLRNESGPNQGLPAVALTAHASDDMRDRAIAAGFSAYLTKPVLPSALVNVVATVGRQPAGN